MEASKFYPRLYIRGIDDKAEAEMEGTIRNTQNYRKSVQLSKQFWKEVEKQTSEVSLIRSTAISPTTSLGKKPVLLLNKNNPTSEGTAKSSPTKVRATPKIYSASQANLDRSKSPTPSLSLSRSRSPITSSSTSYSESNSSSTSPFSSVHSPPPKDSFFDIFEDHELKKSETINTKNSDEFNDMMTSLTEIMKDTPNKETKEPEKVENDEPPKSKADFSWEESIKDHNNSLEKAAEEIKKIPPRISADLSKQLERRPTVTELISKNIVSENSLGNIPKEVAASPILPLKSMSKMGSRRFSLVKPDEMFTSSLISSPTQHSWRMEVGLQRSQANLFFGFELEDTEEYENFFYENFVGKGNLFVKQNFFFLL